jgi:hypothetical protein
MSLVVPQLNIFNQEELIKAPDDSKFYTVRPIITSHAQINYIYTSTLDLWIKTYTKIIATIPVADYFKCIFLPLLETSIAIDCVANI